MNTKYLKTLRLCRKNFLFWLSRKIDYPLVPPDMVQLNFTFRCNLACKMCSMHDQMKFLQSQGRQVEIDSDVFRKVIRETKELGVDNLLFIGGEPFLRKDLFDLVGYAKSLGLNVIIVTNGVLLDESNIKKCFDSGVNWLSVSIDAASEKIFSRIRGENVLGKMMNNINLLNSMKSDMKKESPKIVTCSTIMNDNLEELLDIVNLCRSLKIEKILFQPVVANNIDQTERDANSPGSVPLARFDILDKAIDGLIAYKKRSLDNYDFIANDIRNLKLIKKYFKGKIRPWEYPCYAGYNRLQIIQEGRVYFCVNQQKHEANFGDIKSDSLKDLWFSKKARFYRKLIKECKNPCMQWCSYRDGFIELSDVFQKRFIFKDN